MAKRNIANFSYNIKKGKKNFFFLLVVSISLNTVNDSYSKNANEANEFPLMNFTR